MSESDSYRTSVGDEEDDGLDFAWGRDGSRSSGREGGSGEASAGSANVGEAYWRGIYDEGVTLIGEGHYSAAISNLRQVVDQGSDYAHYDQARYQLARAYELSGNDEAAWDLYNALAGYDNAYQSQATGGISRIRERRQLLRRMEDSFDEMEADEPRRQRSAPEMNDEALEAE